MTFEKTMIRIVQSSDKRSVARLLSPARVRDTSIERRVARIVDDVRKQGDRALQRYARRLDGLTGAIEVPRREWKQGAAALAPEVRRAIRAAARHIRHVARAQVPRGFRTVVAPGISIEQRVVPLERVGCYVPGGRYPLPSSLLMTAIPARAAGVQEVIAVCPRIDPAVLGAAMACGVDRLFQIILPVINRQADADARDFRGWIVIHEVSTLK